MMRYKRLASGTKSNQAPAKKPKVEVTIDPRLQQRIRDLGSVDSERQNLINTMALGLARWIDEAITGEDRTEAAKRILNCYVAQLQGKTDETATKLNIEGLGLKTLPPDIGRLTSLPWLDLDNNQLTTLPPEIGGLTSLTALWLENNQLTTLPPEIGGLTSLGTLSLGYNPLTILPAEIGRLTSLRRLSLAGNRLTTLPPEIGGLTSLTALYLSGNQLTTLPAEIGLLTSLKVLGLSGNRLTILPPDIGRLTSLIGLNLENNQLTTVPPEIGRLTRLMVLILAGNQLTTVPTEIGLLTRLREIKLSKNYLTEAARANFPERSLDEETGLADQKVDEELQKDLEKNSEQIASMTKKILSCETVIDKKYSLLSGKYSLLSGSLNEEQKGNDTGPFQQVPMQVIWNMMIDFLDRDDMQNMRDAYIWMNQIDPTVEEIITQREILHGYETLKEMDEQSRVHLEGIATPEPETEKDT